MKSEKIIRIGRLCYAKLFDMDRELWSLKDEKGQWETKRLFWRFYWLKPEPDKS